jgi:hypothetical protein
MLQPCGDVELSHAAVSSRRTGNEAENHDVRMRPPRIQAGVITTLP